MHPADVFYRKAWNLPLRSRGDSGKDILEAIGDRELVDANLTEARRSMLKDAARTLGGRFSSNELIYLVGAIEVQANSKRSEEERTYS